MISVAGMIFSGPLAGFLRQGIGLCLFGGVALGVAGALGTSFRGTICHPQDVTGVIVALSAAAIAARLGGGAPQILYATVAVLIALASVVTGLAFIAAGALRLGVLARFIPYPVMGGFMAAAGYLMTAGAIRMVAGQSALSDLMQPEALWRWLPVIGLGSRMVWIARRSGRVLALPALVVLAFAGFYLWLLLSGVSLEEAGRRGLLLGPFEVDRGFLGAFRLGLLAQADYGAILPEIPAIATLVGLAFVGAMLNASGIELGTGQPVDLNRDLRGVGVANLLAGLGGGVAGYHILGGTLLAQPADRRRLALDRRRGRPDLRGGAGRRRLAARGAAGRGLRRGAGVPRHRPALPVALGGAAAPGGAGLPARRRHPRHLRGGRLPPGDRRRGAGRLGAVRLRLFAGGRDPRPPDRRRCGSPPPSGPSPSVRLLTARGRETLIFELQGYVFFGTAHTLLGDLTRDVAEPGSAIRNVVLDFRRVQGLDASAVFNLGKLEQVCSQHGVRLLFTDLRPALRRQMERAGLTDRIQALATLDEALSRIEEEVLAETPDTAERAPGFAELLARASAAGAPLFQPESVPAGTAVLRQGEASDCLILLERGRLSASVDGPEGGRMRVATFLPGALVGEIGLYAGTARTATVAADVDSTIRRVTRESIDRLSERDPALARDLHAMVAGLLARRLTRATALLREMTR